MHLKSDFHIAGQLMETYPEYSRNRKKVGTSDYLRVMRLRQIWAEGTFAVLKREHKLNKIQKRGL